MVRTAQEGWESAETLLKEVTGGDDTLLDGKMIFDAAVRGDAYARWVFDETATWIGLGAASMVNALNPEKIVLCGGMIAAGDMLFDTVRKVMRANTFEVPGKRCEILPAGLGADSGVIGCAGCALARYQQEH